MSVFGPLHASPAAGFDEPFDLLAACHERVQRSLGLLQRLLRHVASHGVDAPARQAAQDVMRYFDVAAPLHHDDEERHVFPVLLRSADPGLVEVVAQLRADHREMARTWSSLRPWLARVHGGDPSCAAERPEALVAEMVMRYAAHLEREDGIAFPAARAATPREQWPAIGEEMASRRRG